MFFELIKVHLLVSELYIRISKSSSSVNICLCLPLEYLPIEERNKGQERNKMGFPFQE